MVVGSLFGWFGFSGVCSKQDDHKSRAGLDALLTFGRPASVQLLVLVDRRFSRELPIQPDYVGKWVDSIGEQRVTVEWKETDGQDRVMLHVLEQEGRPLPPAHRSASNP